MSDIEWVFSGAEDDALRRERVAFLATELLEAAERTADGRDAAAACSTFDPRLQPDAEAAVTSIVAFARLWAVVADDALRGARS